jgi:CRP-like cAMP-binding protein
MISPITDFEYDPIPKLLKCKILSTLDIDELTELGGIGRVEFFKKGQAVFRKGKAMSEFNDNGRIFYIVLEGKLLLRLKNKRTKEYQSGHVFGEVRFLGDTERSGTVRAIEDSILMAFDKEVFFDSNLFPTALSLKIVLLLTKEIVSYFEQEIRYDIRNIISKGESDSVEFKGSISKGQKKSIVRSLVAFMNLNGGTVLCGIGDDNGEIIGINSTLKQIDDFQKGIFTEARERVGFHIDRSISFTIVDIDDKQVLRIDCESAESPVFYKEKTYVSKKTKKGMRTETKTDDYFVVRTGSENVKIKRAKDVINYVRFRFKK